MNSRSATFEPVVIRGTRIPKRYYYYLIFTLSSRTPLKEGLGYIRRTVITEIAVYNKRFATYRSTHLFRFGRYLHFSVAASVYPRARVLRQRITRRYLLSPSVEFEIFPYFPNIESSCTAVPAPYYNTVRDIRIDYGFGPKRSPDGLVRF